MRDRKVWIVLLLIFIVGLAHEGSAQMRRVRLGYIPIVSLLPLYAALEQGYFKEEGVEVKLTPMAGGAVIIPAVVGGSLDIGFSAYFSAIAAREKGIDVTIVAATVWEIGPPQPYVAVLVRKGAGISSAKDLEGKNFAVNTIRSVDWLTTSEWMAKNGADPRKVKWVEIPFPVMGGALRTGKVDAITGLDPFLTIEMDRGGVKIVGYPFPAIDPQLPVAGFVATSTWIRRNQNTVKGFRRGLSRGTDYINGHPERRGEILVKFTRVKGGLAERLKFYPAFEKQINAAALQKTVDLAVKWGLIKKRVDIREMVLPGILR